MEVAEGVEVGGGRGGGGTGVEEFWEEEEQLSRWDVVVENLVVGVECFEGRGEGGGEFLVDHWVPEA